MPKYDIDYSKWDDLVDSDVDQEPEPIGFTAASKLVPILHNNPDFRNIAPPKPPPKPKSNYRVTSSSSRKVNSFASTASPSRFSGTTPATPAEEWVKHQFGTEGAKDLEKDAEGAGVELPSLESSSIMMLRIAHPEMSWEEIGEWLCSYSLLFFSSSFIFVRLFLFEYLFTWLCTLSRRTS